MGGENLQMRKQLAYGDLDGAELIAVWANGDHRSLTLDELGQYLKSTVQRGKIFLSVAAQTTLTNLGQWYPFDGVFTDGDSNGFSLTEDDGILTYSGPDNAIFLVNGTSDLSASVAGNITYGMHVNDVLIANGETPIDFPAQNKNANISITDYVVLNNGDTMQIKLKSSDTAGMVADVQSLRVTLWGGYPAG